MKIFVLILSQTFPVKHKRAGFQTLFKEKLNNAINYERSHREYIGFTPRTKKHTLRANDDLWVKRFELIERGEACLSIRIWSGKPYASKQIELCRLTKEDGIGLQKLQFFRGSLCYPTIDGKPCDCTEVAANDGLSLDDWLDWFRSYDISKPLAVIHLTPFRY